MDSSNDAEWITPLFARGDDPRSPPRSSAMVSQLRRLCKAVSRIFPREPLDLQGRILA